MSAHTPRPWFYRGEGEISDCNGIPVAEAYLRADDSYADDKNGRLIAAAPELLAAARTALGVLTSEDLDPQDAIDELEQAIAKAVGGQA